MKKTGPALTMLFLATATAAIATLVLLHDPWTSIILMTAATLSGIALLILFKRTISALVQSSSAVITGKVDTKRRGFFTSFRLLSENLEATSRKLKIAIQLIKGLTDPEKIDPITQLGKDDQLGIALQNIKTEMMRMKDEDARRAWITEGLAKFAEILKQRTELKDIGKDIISNLVKYLNVNQGGIFIHRKEEGEEYLELLACYAYSKHKFVEKKIAPGQGMIGQCMFEKDFVFVTDIPKDYVKITSGLGESTPRNIVVAPLIFNDLFCGAIEIASFEVLPPYKVEFLKKVCTNIAAELVSLRNADQTRQLLSESTVLAQALQVREQEMKNNLETLAATQEQMSRKQAELNGYLASVNNTIACAEFNMDSTFRLANEIFLRVMGYQEAELVNQGFEFFMGDDPSVVMMWENLRLGTFFAGEFRMKSKAGKELWLSGTFTPIIIGGKAPEKIILLAQFVTQEKEKLSDLNAMVSAVKATLPIMEFNEHFVCKTANDKALQMFGLSRLQLRNKTILDFVSAAHRESWDKTKNDILQSDFSNRVMQFEYDRQIMNFEVTVTLVRNHDGKVSKVILLFVRLVNDWVPALTGE